MKLNTICLGIRTTFGITTPLKKSPKRLQPSISGLIDFALFSNPHCWAQCFIKVIKSGLSTILMGYFLVFYDNTQAGQRIRKASENFLSVPTLQGPLFWGAVQKHGEHLFPSQQPGLGLPWRWTVGAIKELHSTNIKPILNYLFCAFTFHCSMCQLLKGANRNWFHHLKLTASFSTSNPPHEMTWLCRLMIPRMLDFQ